MKKVYPILLLIFSIFWIGFVLLDYLQKHPYYISDIQFFQYWDLLSLVFAQAIGGGLVYHYFRKEARGLLKGGLLILPSFILIGVTFAFALNRGTPVAAKSSEVIHVLGNYLKVALQVFFIVIASYSIGLWCIDRLKVKLKPISKTTVSIATGIMVIVMIAFIVGIFNGLYWFTLGPILLGCVALNYKKTLTFLKKLCVETIKPSKQLGFLGVFSFLVLLFLIQLNLLQNISPFPKGWDSLALYVKLPTIINDYHGLVRGYQPYNWSLLMSFGLILFNSVETVLALSFLGGVLVLLGLYAIGKDILKIDQNYILLGLLTFYLIPSVAFQSFQEQKVDLGLLFIVLTLIILLFHWIADRKAKIAEDENAFTRFDLKTMANPYLIIMGLLTGFAFGIKLTTLFSYFSIICIIWFLEFGFIGFVGSTFLCLFAILIVKLDDMSGMREYHLTADYLQWILLILGFSAFAYLFTRFTKAFSRSIFFSLIYSIFFAFMTIPWITKNYLDSDKKLSFRYLLNGKTNEPPAGLNYMKRKYQQQLKKEESIEE
mgnify:CR=1 FL=1